MPIDPVLLRPPPPPPPAPPRWRRGLSLWGMAGGGTALEVLLFLAAMGHEDDTRFFVTLVLILGAACTAGLLWSGLRDDGLVGALYELKHPFGTTLAGDPRPSGLRVALAWLLILGVSLSGILLAMTPNAAPFVSGAARTPSNRP